MTGEEGVCARYGAYSLALKLGWTDVDAMLSGMTAMQYQEWLAFFAIRARRGKNPQSGRGASDEEQRRLNADIVRAMSGYQNRRAALKR